MLSVDPGYEVQHIIARLRRHRSSSLTGGFGFTQEEYLRCFDQSGFTVAASGGNPHLSNALLVPGVAKSTWSWVGRALAYQRRRDSDVSGYRRFALHRWLLSRRPEAMP